MNKNAKKVNPYEKKKKRSLKITRKQWTIIIALLCAVALIVGIIIAGNLRGDGHYEGDGHNHGNSAATGNSHYEGDGHDHGSNSTSTNNSDKVKYQIYTNADNTYRVVFRDTAGKTVAEFDKLAKQPLKETKDANKGVYELGWATGDGPSDFECVYYNVKTGQVSQQFRAPRGTDGVRIAYGSEDQTKVIVQDLFDKNAYYKEYTLENATEKNGNIIVGGKLNENRKTVVISYNSSETETNAHVTINLYE